MNFLPKRAFLGEQLTNFFGHRRGTLFVRSLLALSASCLVTGCSKANPDYAESMVDVLGTVTLDGEPLAGAMLTFIATEGPSRTTAATTGPAGAYSLKTSDVGTGVVPGSYLVVINKFVQPDGSPVPQDTPPMDVGATDIIPEMYSSFAMPTLSAEVTSDGGLIDFDLTSQ